MRVDQALVVRALCDSRTEAQELIHRGHVLLNGLVITKTTREVSDTDMLEVLARRKYVSRGGEKLEGALLDYFGTEEVVRNACKGKTALDIGSSTGGFSQCLLTYGVSHIDAVDVGSNQFHDSLRTDERISLYEQTDIRTFSSKVKYDIVVADLSFISLLSILECVLSFGKQGALYMLLIKPQFEVGKGNTKKGIVKDESLIQNILQSYEEQAHELGLCDIKIFPCRIKGGDGNQEYCIVGRLRAK